MDIATLLNSISNLLAARTFFDMSIDSRSWNGGLVEHNQGWSSPFSDPSNDERGQSSKVKDIPRGDHNEETSEEASFDSILSSYTKHISANPPMNPVGTPELSNMLALVYGPKVSDMHRKCEMNIALSVTLSAIEPDLM